MNLKQKFNQLQKSIRDRPLTSIEISSLMKDLDLMNKRLEKKEYAKGFRSSPNTFDVAYRTEQAYIELEFISSVSDIWQVILSHIPFASVDTIIDVCPGYTPKIEIALQRLGYAKELTIIDQDAKATDRLLKILRLFRPQFETKVINKNIVDVEIQSSLVVANHALDDIILESWASNHAIALAEIYADESLVKNVWKEIMKNKKHIYTGVVPKIIQTFARLVRADGYFCLTQYPSYMEKLLDLQDSIEMCSELFKYIPDFISENGFQNVSDQLQLSKFPIGSHFHKQHCVILHKDAN